MSFFKKIKNKITSTFSENVEESKSQENIEIEKTISDEKELDILENTAPIDIHAEIIPDGGADVKAENEVLVKEDIPVEINEKKIINDVENIHSNAVEAIDANDFEDDVDDIHKEVPEPVEEKKSFFKRIVEKTTETVKYTFGIEKIKEGLSKTRKTFSDSLRKTLGFGRKIDEALLNEIEEILITADIGVDTTEQVIDSLRVRVKKENYESAEYLYDLLKEEIEKILIESPSAQNDRIYEIDDTAKPFVILVIGVNGVGKTTTIGKLAHNYKNAGKSVIIGAADTFRAAANEQLEIWAERAGVDIVQQKQGADPAAVAFDTLKSAQAKNKDVVIIDTAGRLHNKAHLMAELDKISRVMKKIEANAPHEVYLILDATTGQNAIFQAKEFSKVAPLTGIILTKLDGTAKGGVVIPIANELKIPVRYIGVGEKIDDLQVFDTKAFVDALFDESEKQ